MARKKPAVQLARWVLAAACLFVFIAPYFQGLYFEKHRFAAEILVFALALLWLVVSTSARSPATPSGAVFPRGLLGLGALAVPIAYLVATPLAASPRSAIGETLAAAMALAVMWMVSETCVRENDLDLPVKAIALSGIVIALIGMATATKVYTYPSAWEGGRLYSTLQYPNTAASALMAAFFCGATQWIKAANRARERTCSVITWLETALWGWAGAVVAVGFILTLSRGAWVVLPFAAALFLVGLPWQVKPAAVCYLAMCLLSAIPSASLFNAALNPLDVARAWTSILGASAGAALILLVGVALLSGIARGKSPSPDDGPGDGRPVSATPAAGLRRWRRLSALIVVAGVMVVILVGGVLARRYGSSGPMTRLRAIALSESGLQERIIWPLDAVRIALHRPVTGFGGGGWAMVYTKYRQYPYYSKLVHNHFAQVLVDTGLAGLAAFLLFCWGLARSAWEALRDRESGNGLKTTVWGAGTAALALVAHGAIDFNLNLPAVAAFLWALAGVVHGGSRTHRQATSLERALEGVSARKACGGVFAACAVLAMCLALSGWLGERGARAWKQEEHDEAVSLMQKAAALDPFSAPVRADLGQYCRLLGEARRDGDLMRKALDMFASAVHLSPYDSLMRLDYAALLSRTGQMGPAIRHAQIAVNNDPFLSVGYEVLTGLHVENGKRLALAGKVDEARASFAAGLAIKDALDKRNSGIPEQYRRFVRPETQLRVTPMMSVYRAQARFFLGDRDAMAEELKPALSGKAAGDKEAQARAIFWDGLLIGSRGDHETAGKRMMEALKIDPEIQSEGPRAKDICEKLGLDYDL